MTQLIIGWKKFETEFRGKKVTMEIWPFKRKAMMVIRPFITGGMPEVKSTMSDEEIGKLADKAFELQGLAADLFPDHVRNIQGLEDIVIDEHAVTFQDLAEETALLPLTLAIITQMASISSLNSGEAKNSGGPSDSMEGQAGTEQ